MTDGLLAGAGDATFPRIREAHRAGSRPNFYPLPVVSFRSRRQPLAQSVVSNLFQVAHLRVSAHVAHPLLWFALPCQGKPLQQTALDVQAQTLIAV